jgi:hypothetical protein
MKACKRQTKISTITRASQDGYSGRLGGQETDLETERRLPLGAPPNNGFCAAASRSRSFARTENSLTSESLPMYSFGQ